MAWTMAFALLGALFFSIIVCPVLASFAFAKGASEWRNPVMEGLMNWYRIVVRWAISRRSVTVGVAGLLVIMGNILAFGGFIGSEFLPHLDEGAIWVRGVLAPSAGPDEGIRVANRALLISRGSAMHKPDGASRRWSRHDGFL
jgi:cobalt-zinc-cadmium resistance protein CzcA